MMAEINTDRLATKILARLAEHAEGCETCMAHMKEWFPSRSEGQ